MKREARSSKSITAPWEFLGFVFKVAGEGRKKESKVILGCSIKSKCIWLQKYQVFCSALTLIVENFFLVEYYYCVLILII